MISGWAEPSFGSAHGPTARGWVVNQRRMPTGMTSSARRKSWSLKPSERTRFGACLTWVVPCMWDTVTGKEVAVLGGTTPGVAAPVRVAVAAPVAAVGAPLGAADGAAEGAADGAADGLVVGVAPAPTLAAGVGAGAALASGAVVA